MQENMAESAGDFLRWLDGCVNRVRGFDASLKNSLQVDDVGAYKGILLEKAEFLAELRDEGEKHLAGLEPALAAQVASKLAAFSESAERALEIGSSFYMSALLYDDEHAPDAPNNLEKFAAEMHARLSA